MTLTVVDSAGQFDTEGTTVTFNPGAPPVAVIMGPALVDETSATNGTWYASFNGTDSTDDVGIWKYDWNFGNGTTASGAAVRAAYNSTGNCLVTLTVTDNAGQTNSTTQTVTVKANHPPVAAITGPRLLDERVAANGLWFGAWNGLASTDDSGVYRYDWSFGDGATTSGASVTHQYAAKGIFPLTLKVYDNANQTAILTQDVVVAGNELPVPRITASPLPPEGAQPVSLSGAASSDDYGIMSYRWLLPPRLFDFAGQLLDTNEWRTANATQNDRLLLTGQGNWGQAYFYNTNFTIPRGSLMEGRVDTSTGTSYAMIGLRDLDSGSGDYRDLVYAIYFADATV